MVERPEIPAEIRRIILVEAGHRCAIQLCRAVSDVDIHHIVPWGKCKNHDPANLIALCPTCHRRADRGSIDRKSLFKYKEICRKLIKPPHPHMDNEIKAFIKFNPNTVTEIHDAKNISSLVDNGILDFSFIFIEGFDDPGYVVHAIGNGSVGFTVLSQIGGSIRLKFVAPCPDIVRIEFKY